MAYKESENIPRKYDFTKNRWPSVDYEKQNDEDLLSKIEEIDEDTKSLNKKYDEYCKFLKKIIPICKEENEEFGDYISFVKENFKRTSKEEKIKEFIFFERDVTIHDNYFEDHVVEHSFFSKATHLISMFKKIYKLYSDFYQHHGMGEFKYFFPKDYKHSNFGPFYPSFDSPFRLGYIHEIEKFTELRRQRYMSHSSFDPQPCTHRTYEFYEKLHNLGVESIFDVNGNQRKLYTLHVPSLPNESYARWYFNKIIDENNKLKRRIELILRSRKRSVELATTDNFIYIMSNEGLPKDTYKIGWTGDLPEERAENISSTGVLHDYKVEYSKKFKDAENIEQQIHKHFNKFRVKKNKEFFTIKLEKIIEYIESIK